MDGFIWNDGLVFRIGAWVLIGIGIWGLLTQRNIIKILVSIGIMETGVNIFLLALFYSPGAIAPILQPVVGAVAGGTSSTDPALYTDPSLYADPSLYTDPLPQALVLTSIVIGTAVLALGVALAIRTYQHTGHTHISRMLEDNA
jgi:multicomponent Na+:H+ antiporter subunit C